MNDYAGHPLVKLPLDLTLRSERTISLTITRADTGQPFVGVNIDARQEEGLASSAFDASDEFGKAKLTLPPGKFNLRGSPPLGTDYIRTSQELTVGETPAEQAVELKMNRGCVLILRAVDADTGEPIPGVSFWEQVEIAPRGRGGRAGRREVQLNTTHVSHTKTDKQGELRSVAVPGTRRYGVGWIQLPDGYAAADPRDERQGRDVTLIGGQGQKVVFNLRKKPAPAAGAQNVNARPAFSEARQPEEAAARVFPTTITGRALEKGRPLEGATICLVKTNCEVEKVYAETRTDAEGRYEFANVPLESNGVGDWYEMAYFRVVGKAPGKAFAWRGMKNMFIDPAAAERARMTGRIQATPDPRLTGFVRGERIELDLEFQPATPIAGRIVDDAGKPVAGVTVTLMACDRIDAAGNAAAEHENFKVWVWYHRKPTAFLPDQLSTTSDAEGKFELANAPPSAVCCLGFGHVQYAPLTVYASTSGNPPATHKNNPVAKLPLMISLQSQVSDKAAEKEKPALEPAKAKDGAKAKAAAPEDEAAKPRTRNHPLSVSGKALDQNGQPIAGATIFLVATNNSPDKLIGQTATGDDGRYEFRNAQLPYYTAEKKDDYEDGTFQVFGKAPSVGFAWHGMRFLHIDPRHRDENGKSLLISPSYGFFPEEAIDLDLIFQPAKPVRGRFVDDQGRPIQGVKVSLTNCDYLDTNGKEDNLAFREFRSAVRQAQQAMPDQLQCTSDADGRFEFQSFPQGIGCRLAMRHPDYGLWALYTATADSPPQKFAGADVVPLPIEMVRHKTRTISLQVRYADTRAPVVGAHVGAYLQLGTNNDWGECDKQGKVTFKLPPGEYTAWAHPPQGADYLSVHAPIVVRPTEQAQSAELILDRACVLLLKASDAATGAGVEKVNFCYEEESQPGKKWFVQSNDTTNDFPVTNAQGELRALVRRGTRRYGIGLNPLPDDYRADNDDKASGRVLTLPAGQTVTTEFLLQK